MKPTQLTDLLSNIRATFVSFFSILMFVALGVGIFLGILWAGPALFGGMGSTFEKNNFHHIQLIYPYGLTEEHIEQVRQTDGVESAEGIYAAVVSGQYADSSTGSLKVQSLPETIDTLEVLEGALPQNANEVAILELFAEESGLEVGSSIALIPLGKGQNYLEGEQFRVCGIVRSAEYTSENTAALGQSGTGSGKLDGIVYAPKSAFNTEAFSDGFPIVNVRVDGLEGLSTFSNEYKQQSNTIEQRLVELGEMFALERFNSLQSVGQTEIDKAQTQIDEGAQQIEDGEEQLAQVEEELASAKEQIASGEEQLTEAEKEIEEGEQQLTQAQTELDAGRAQIAQAESQIASGQAQLEQKKKEAEAQLADAQKQLASARQQLDSAKTQAESARQQLDEAKAQLVQVDEAKAAGKAKIVEVRSKFDSLKEKLAAGEITQEEYHAALDEYGAQLRSELVFLASAMGQDASAIPTLNHENFEVVLSMLEQSFDGLVEGFVITVGGEEMTIAEVRTKVAQGEAELAAAEAEIASGEEQYATGQAEFEAAKAEAEKQIAAAEAQLDQARQQLESARAQEAQGEAQIASGRQQLEAGKQEFAEKQTELEEGKEKIAEGEEQLFEKKEELTEAQSKLDEAIEEVTNAQEALVSMNNIVWTVAPRAYNGGVIEAETLGTVTTNLSFSMALLFVIVGLLVCYSAVSRIVHEQIIQIGTKKALGLNEREITTSFLGYSGIAVLLGAIVGIALGVIAVEGIINNTLAGRFRMNAYGPYVGIAQALGVIALELVLILGATWFACRGVLKKQAVELLRGEDPPKAKQRFFENWGVWEKLPLLTQTMVNNCLNDKRRVFSTVVGVAGCTALIITAITLNNDVLKSYDVHYADVYHFDTVVYIDSAENENLAVETTQQLHAEGASAAAVRMQNFALYLDNGDVSRLRLIVPQNEDNLAQVYTCTPVLGSNAEAAVSGVWINRAYAEHLNAQVGDEITISSGDGTTHKLPIAGFFNYRIAIFEAVVDSQTYEQEFGSAPAYNAILLDTLSAAGQDYAATAQTKAGILAVANDKENQRSNFDAFAKVSRTVVLVYLVLAVLMAVIVLLNLNTMFIEEKKRELIVLMINGFSAKDAKRYIYRDNIALTVLGIVLGVVLGCVMGSVTVGSIEPSTASFVKGIDWPAVGIGVVGAAVLSAIMTAIALRRIPRFNLTDINRF